MQLVVDANVLLSAFLKNALTRKLLLDGRLELYAPEFLLNVTPHESYSFRMKEALSIAPHPEDAPYLALSLTCRLPIWSNDQGLKEQSKIKVYTTSELIKILP